MHILNRRVRIRQIMNKLLEFGRMGISSLQFKRVQQLWASYLRAAPPPGNSLELRDGLKIALSGNPHDVITVMVNFCRQEYGKVLPAWTVVDIGGNIGAFALFAARSGASGVFCYEPNQEAFNVLNRNIFINNLDERVKAYNLAVSGNAGDLVWIAKSSSPYNKTRSGEEALPEGGEAVSTTTVEALLEQNGLEYVDLLKMDCEGAEYEILMGMPNDVLKKVHRIRMELHPSRQFSRMAVVERLKENGFSVVKQSGMIYWFERGDLESLGAEETMQGAHR